jgi:alpha-D-ribose 1-methylphosphonate 5-triphosphate synthase subunit PhnG
MLHAPSPADPGRSAMMAVCAEASRHELAHVLDAIRPDAVRDLRAPEIGLVMLRGRMGGDGAAFNLGEATIARAAVEVDGIGTGFAYHLGRDTERARQAAIIDALWQAPARRDEVEALLGPVRERIEAERARSARQVAATRVNFFTLARGED